MIMKKKVPVLCNFGPAPLFPYIALRAQGFMKQLLIKV